MAYGPKDKDVSVLVDAVKKVVEKEKEKTKTLADAGTPTAVAEVVHYGEKITLPEGMSLPDALSTILRRMEYMEKPVILQDVLDVFPYDGALALDHVLTEKYGWSQATGTPSWFGEVPPSLISVNTGPDQFVRVPWGGFQIPGIEGQIAVGLEKTEAGRFKFKMIANIRRKDEATVNDVFLRTKQYLKTNSIYRGKAVKVKFCNDDGKALPMPEIEFIDTSMVEPEQLILSDEVFESIDTNLFTPIRRVHDCLANDIPVKRGVLLGGSYGTGKTLAASVASRYATDTGVTYVYVPKAKELPEALEFAKQYQSPACVVFCEDIDRVMSGERDAETDEILNLIDGIDVKSQHIIVVVTTNDLNAVETAMLRPGRLDAVIEVSPPDAKAVERLLRYYGRETILADTNLAEAGVLLDGQIPAVIAEVVNRAKLAQLRLNAPGQRVENLSEAALVEASRTMRKQVQLLKDRTDPQPDEGFIIEDHIRGVVYEQVHDEIEPMKDMLKQMSEVVNSIRENV